MVVQKTLAHLRNRPHEERKKVAAGAALFVIALLFTGWIVYFIKKVQSGSSVPQGSAQTAAVGGVVNLRDIE